MHGEPALFRHSLAHYLWAVLIARIYGVFPLLFHMCGGQMSIIAFITHSADIRQMFGHIGVQAQPSNIASARGPPLWKDCDAQMSEGVESEPDWNMAKQRVPDYELDQGIKW